MTTPPAFTFVVKDSLAVQNLKEYKKSFRQIHPEVLYPFIRTITDAEMIMLVEAGVYPMEITSPQLGKLYAYMKDDSGKIWGTQSPDAYLKQYMDQTVQAIKNN
jgi:hypothetical protein